MENSKIAFHLKNSKGAQLELMAINQTKLKLVTSLKNTIMIQARHEKKFSKLVAKIEPDDAMTRLTASAGAQLKSGPNKSMAHFFGSNLRAPFNCLDIVYIRHVTRMLRETRIEKRSP